MTRLVGVATAALVAMMLLASLGDAQDGSDANVEVTIGPGGAQALADPRAKAPFFVKCRYGCDVKGTVSVTPEVARRLGLKDTDRDVVLADLEGNAGPDQPERLVTFVRAIDRRLNSSLRFPIYDALPVKVTVDASYAVPGANPEDEPVDQHTTAVVKGSLRWPRTEKDTGGVGVTKRHILAGISGPKRVSIRHDVTYKLKLRHIDDDFVFVSVTAPGARIALGGHDHIYRGSGGRHGRSFRSNIDSRGRGTLEITLPLKGRRQARRTAPFLPMPAELALAAGHKTDPHPDHAIYRFTLVP